MGGKIRLRDAERFKLHFGPYRTPRFKLGSVVQDEIRGEVRITRITAGRIPWPVGIRNRGWSLVVYGDLARAIRRESPAAVMYWWGISRRTTVVWRRALDVPPTNDGTHRLRVSYTKLPWFKRFLHKGTLISSQPSIRTKAADAWRGKKRPEHVGRAISAALKGRPWSEKRRRKYSVAFAKQGKPIGFCGRLWTAKEDEWVRTLSPADAARKTGRSKTAIYLRRRILKVARAWK
jgi:hypothetical protein